MFGKEFQRRYALTDQGVKNTKKGAFWTVIVNLIVMAGMGILYYMMQGYMQTLTDGAPLPKTWVVLLLVLGFLVLSFVTHRQQYKATYGLVYGEVKATRISLAERLRKLPLGWFGKRDLADLTETIMGDVNRLEHVWSHCLGYLYGSWFSTAIIAVMLLVYDWRLALAALWGVPVAFGLLFGSRKLARRNAEAAKAAGLQVSDGIQETLENIREIRATNQEGRFLTELNGKIDRHEKAMIRGELSTGIFVNAASVIMRLGVATTILTGAGLILAGQINFMVFFMFLAATLTSLRCLTLSMASSWAMAWLPVPIMAPTDASLWPKRSKAAPLAAAVLRAVTYVPSMRAFTTPVSPSIRRTCPMDAGSPFSGFPGMILTILRPAAIISSL